MKAIILSEEMMLEEIKTLQEARDFVHQNCENLHEVILAFRLNSGKDKCISVKIDYSWLEFLTSLIQKREKDLSDSTAHSSRFMEAIKKRESLERENRSNS